MPTNTFGDTYIRGLLKCDNFECPNEALGDAAFSAGDPLTVEKQEHQYVFKYCQSGLASIATAREAIHQAMGSGRLIQFQAGFAIDESSWTGNAVVDLHKNGATILSGTITLNATITVRAKVLGTIASNPYVEDDLFEVVVTFTAGTGTPPKGLFVFLTVREDQD